MKNKLFWAGIFSMALAAGVLFVSCGTTSTGSGESSGDDPMKFEGKWVNLSAINNYGFTEFSFTFTGNKMLFQSVDRNGKLISKPGTFTFTGTRITFKPEQANTWQGYTQSYKLSGDKLELANDGQHDFGVFRKQ